MPRGRSVLNARALHNAANGTIGPYKQHALKGCEGRCIQNALISVSPEQSLMSAVIPLKFATARSVLLRRRIRNQQRTQHTMEEVSECARLKNIIYATSQQIKFFKWRIENIIHLHTLVTEREFLCQLEASRTWSLQPTIVSLNLRVTIYLWFQTSLSLFLYGCKTFTCARSIANWLEQFKMCQPKVDTKISLKTLNTIERFELQKERISYLLRKS